jgi:tetratricopeptide (TPR) repeat protein
MEKKWAAPVLLAALALSAATDWVFSTAYRDKWAYYGNALQTNPASGLANLNYGIFLRQEGDHKMAEALPYFEKAVAGSPGYYDGHLRLAECLNILGRSREALPHADEALRLLGEKNWPDALKGDAHSVRGAVRGKLGDHAAALQDFEAARRYKPADPAIAYNLGLALRNVERREEALALFEEAVAKRPDYAEAWYELGFNNGVLNRFDAAKRALDQAVRLRPENADALLFRGLAQQSLGNLPAACDWQKAAQLGKQEAAAFGQQHCR